MENTYTYFIENGKILYKGIKSTYADPKYSHISWFSENPNSPEKYTLLNGKKVGEVFTYKTIKELKLININSMFFRLHFVDKVNMLYKGDSFNEDKIKLFSVLGIPDLHSVNYVVNKYFTQKPTYVCKDSTSEDTKKIMLFAQYLGGHRLSEYNMDKFFAETLKELYGQTYDGYIAPLDSVSCFHKVLPSEICLFRPFRSVKLLGKHNANKAVKKGGKQENEDWIPPWKSHNFIDIETIEDYNTRKLIKLRGLGYLRNVTYDEEGRLDWPPYEEVIDGIKESTSESNDPYVIAKKYGYTFIPIEDFNNNITKKNSTKTKSTRKKVS
jgi:hypothetical protein